MKRIFTILFIAYNLILTSHICSAQIITTVAGSNLIGCSGDGGQATAAGLHDPVSIAFDAAGNFYISDDGDNRIRKVSTSGIITTVAGTGVTGISGTGGQATAAQIGIPYDIAFDAIGNLYITDEYNNRICKVNTSGILTKVAGNYLLGYSGDGGQATAAKINTPMGIAVDALGNIYIADTYNNLIRKVNTLGIITTLAGDTVGASTISNQGYSGDGGQATAAKLFHPSGITIDAAGNLYIADGGNYCVRMINSSGIITTIAGNGTSGFSGDGAQATAAELSNPNDITIDALGNIYIADFGNNRTRKINTTGIISTIAGNGICCGFSGDGGQATAAELYNPAGIAIDASGNLYIADASNNRIRMVTNATTVGIEAFASNKELVSIYPNPATNSLQVSLAGNSEGSTLIMCDMLGNAVKQTSFNTQHTTLSIADISAGVYFITVTSGASISTQKVVVSK